MKAHRTENGVVRIRVRIKGEDGKVFVAAKMPEKAVEREDNNYGDDCRICKFGYEFKVIFHSYGGNKESLPLSLDFICSLNCCVCVCVYIYHVAGLT